MPSYLDEHPSNFREAAFAYFGVFAIAFVLFMGAIVGSITRHQSCQHELKDSKAAGVQSSCGVHFGLFIPAGVVLLLGLLLTLWLHIRSVRYERRVQSLMESGADHDESERGT